MRLMLTMILLAALGWTGWWFLIAEAKERALEGWLTERRAAGWVAEASAIDVSGFPYRVDTTVRALELANPEAGWAWSVPEFQFLTLAYKPNHLIAIWPPEQSFSTPLGATRILSQTMRGSVVVEPNSRLALERAAIELVGVTLKGDGWDIGLGDALLAARRTGRDEPQSFAYDISFSAKTMTVPEAWTGRLARAGKLEPVIEGARFEAVAVFDGPWDRIAIEAAQPNLKRLAISDMSFSWGKLELRGRGELGVDARGYAEGRIDLRARKWRDMLDLAESTGDLAPGLIAALRGGLGIIAQLGGTRDTLEVPLEFNGGKIRLGPLPIGAAPRLMRR